MKEQKLWRIGLALVWNFRKVFLNKVGAGFKKTWRGWRYPKTWGQSWWLIWASQVWPWLYPDLRYDKYHHNSGIKGGGYALTFVSRSIKACITSSAFFGWLALHCVSSLQFPRVALIVSAIYSDCCDSVALGRVKIWKTCLMWWIITQRQSRSCLLYTSDAADE